MDTPGKGAGAADLGKDLQDRAERIGSQLAELYPEPIVPLTHTNFFEFLCAVMMSAQSTDKKVNEVTPALFRHAGTPEEMAAADVGEVQAIIREVGLAPTKAKNLVAMAGLLVERHGGEVPRTFAELEALPGVGHKTASVLMSQAFGIPAFPVDTHIHRLAQRWRLVGETGNVNKVEAAIKDLYPPEQWHALHLQIIFFGREHCKAQRHDPSGCPICSWAAEPALQPDLFPNSPAGKSTGKSAGKGAGKGATASGKKAAREGGAAAKRGLGPAVEAARDGPEVKAEVKGKVQTEVKPKIEAKPPAAKAAGKGKAAGGGTKRKGKAAPAATATAAALESEEDGKRARSNTRSREKAT